VLGKIFKRIEDISMRSEDVSKVQQVRKVSRKGGDFSSTDEEYFHDR
jgi:hypothetical protein